MRALWAMPMAWPMLAAALTKNALGTKLRLYASSGRLRAVRISRGLFHLQGSCDERVWSMSITRRVVRGRETGERAMEPSVKGTIFRNVADELKKCVDSGSLTIAHLEQELDPDEVELVRGEIAISSWNPASTYCRMLRLLADTAPGDADEYLVESGHSSAQRVLDLGLYAQLDGHTEGRWEDRVGRILVTLSGSFFSFGEWEWMGLVGDEGFKIGVRDAGPFSRELILRTQGFVERIASRAAGGTVVLTHEVSEGGNRLEYCAMRTAGAHSPDTRSA